ncbi:MAG: hypothetical protein FWD49_07395 [Firmicutes bacterium]|nr:hypothetical protein [Bacillota bacterium]
MTILKRKKLKVLLNSARNDGAEAVLRAQAERIEELKRDIVRLSNENSRLRSREEGVSDALIVARAQAKDYLEEAKIRFALECERLEDYRRQWVNYIKDLSSAEKLGLEVVNTEKKLKSCAMEMRALIGKEFLSPCPQEEDFISETERIKDLPVNLKGGNEGEIQMSDEELRALILQLLNKNAG